MKEYDKYIEDLMYTYYLSLSEKDKRHNAAVEAAKEALDKLNITSHAELWQLNYTIAPVVA